MAEDATMTRTVLWRRTQTAGLDYCEIAQRRDGWQCDGVALAQLDGTPTRVQYQIVCDAGWHTQSVALAQWRDGVQRTLDLTRDAADRWYGDGQPLPELAGCRDVDLGITPATNTLPIRRLGLAIGASAAVAAAWVRFPDLTVAPLTQQYTRLAADRYRYDSPGFTAEITVDDWGLAMRYAGGWERVR